MYPRKMSNPKHLINSLTITPNYFCMIVINVSSTDTNTVNVSKTLKMSGLPNQILNASAIKPPISICQQPPQVNR
jgi:hypothetical protein